MNLCRICLSSSADRDICELKIGNDDRNKSFSEILLFCLGIQISESLKIATKLCSKCFKKTLSYYKFKVLALRNDSYLKANQECVVKFEYDCSNNNCNPIQIYDDACCDNEMMTPVDEVKEEPDVKTEYAVNESNSDDELLTVIKRIKEESNINNYIPLETDSSTIKVKKRGRSKKIKLETGTKKKMCEECGQYVKDLKAHSAKHIPLQQRKVIKCKMCDKTFCSYGSRTKHLRLKHLGISSRYKKKCEVCNKEVTDMKGHMIRVHHPEKLQVPCMLCDKRFLSRSLRDIHMMSHTKDKPYECEICHNKFRLKSVLDRHIRQVHENEKSHLCQFCSKTFFKKYHLTVHLRSHTKERPFKCEECSRCFTNISSYKVHKEIHNTEKKYQCDLCDMKFVRKDYLRTHMVCHTKEKRYPCEYCGLRFGRSDHRKRHQYTAHEKHLFAA